MLHQFLAYAAFAWLTLAGVLHFVIDVVSQYVRGVRAPGAETSLYYGLHSSYALSLVLFGIFALVLAQRSSAILGQWPLLLLTALATSAWFAIGFCFIEYREPKIMLGIFVVLWLSFVFTR